MMVDEDAVRRLYRDIIFGKKKRLLPNVYNLSVFLA